MQLLTSLLTHKLCDETLIHSILQGQIPENYLHEMIPYCSNTKLLKAFLENRTLPSALYGICLQQPALDKALLLHIVPHYAKDAATFETLYQHPLADETHHQTLYQMNHLPWEFLLNRLQEQPKNPLLLQMLGYLKIKHFKSIIDKTAVFLLPVQCSAEKLLYIAQNCQTVEQIDSLLARKDLSKDLFKVLLQKDFLHAKHLECIHEKTQDQEILTLINASLLNRDAKSLSKELMLKAFDKNPHLTTNILLSLLQSYTFNDAEALSLLQNKQAIDDSVLLHLIEANPNIGQHIFLHSQSNDAVRNALLNKQSTPDFIMRVIEQCTLNQLHILRTLLQHVLDRYSSQVEHEWTPCLLALLQKHPKHNTDAEDFKPYLSKATLTPSLWLQVLRLKGKAYISHTVAPMTLIEDADAEEIFLLLDKNENFNYMPDELLALAKKCEANAHIQHLLEYELSEQILMVLLKKIFTNKTLGYDNLLAIFSHPKMAAEARDVWLDLLRIKHQKALETSPQTPQARLENALEAFRILAYSDLMQALENQGPYAKIAPLAVEVYLSVHQAYLQHKNDANWDILKQNIEKIIQPAMPFLAEHRGYKQVFADLLNFLLNCITGRFDTNNLWRFWQPKTNHAETIDAVYQAACK